MQGLSRRGGHVRPAGSCGEAEELRKAGPLVLEGFAACKRKAVQAAKWENNYPL